MVQSPGPATAGSKAPVEEFVIPVPLQTPPGDEDINVIAGSVVHMGPVGQTVASQQTSVNCGHAFMLIDSIRPFLLTLLLGLWAPTAKTSPLEFTLTS